MTIFSAFSRAARTQDRDGKWTVYCSVCKEPICQTSIQLGKVTCELCRRVENGEVLTNDAIQQYKASRAALTGVTMINIPQADSNISPVRTMGNGFMKALGFKKNAPPTEAEIVVQEKKRGRLFEQVDLEKQLGDGELGTMESVDKLFGEEDQ